jgi:hypothetical protein
MFITTKNIASLIIDYTGTFGPFVMFAVLYFLIGLCSY